MELGIRLTETVTVSQQIQPEDLKDIAAAGFTMVICNRPDGEDFGQPSFALIEKAAGDAGLKARFLPVGPGGLSPDIVDAFGDALAEAEGPVFAYCRSGTRCTALWALDAAKTEPAGQILKTAAQAGYDMSGLIDPNHPPSS